MYESAPWLWHLLVLAIFAASCVPSGSLRYDDLRADPAFALRLPGAEELGELASAETSGWDGGVPAYAGHIFGTTMSAADVYSFYGRELDRLGWKVQTPPYTRSTVELENRDYCRPRVTFRLAIKDKERAFQPGFYKGRSYATVFDARLLAVNDPCPRPVPIAPTAIP